VLNDEELEAENEDHTLEVDEDDALASNDEKDEEDDEEAVDEEEEDEDEEEEVNPKLVISSSGPPASNVAHQTVVKLPPLSAVVQSVIREPLSSSPSDPVASEPHHGAHPRLLPPAVAQRSDKQALSPIVDLNQGSPDKRKRPPQHQPKKCTSPNPLVDFGVGTGYPYAPDATKVAVSAVPPSPAHVAYIRPPAAVSAAAGVFKTMVPRTAGDVGFPVSPVPYRTAANKMTGPAAYLSPQPPPQVQQVYQAPTPPQPQPPSTSYSPYPIDYATTGAPLPPPPPTIAYRNVLVAPPSHEHALLPSATQQQQSATGTGDSEFGGLVSYFSSQQEDDFDT